MIDRHDLLPGTLDMMVLKILASTPMHGYGIAQQLLRLSHDALHAEEGSLYPALQRMRQRGFVKAEWKQTPNNQRARYYTLTALGRRHLGAEIARFTDLVAVIGGVLGSA
jgi:PadR family transcriptional regulator